MKSRYISSSRALGRGVSCALALVALALAGCVSYTPAPRVDVSQARPVSLDKLVGQWTTRSTGDPWNFPAPAGLTIRPDGTGEHVVSSMFKPNGQRYWIYRNAIRVHETSPGQWVLSAEGPEQTLEGGGTHGYKSPENVPLIWTSSGLVIDVKPFYRSYYSRVTPSPQGSVADLVSQEILALRQRLLLGQGAAQYGPGQGPAGQTSDNTGLHAMTSAFQLGMGLSALKHGNNPAAQLAFQSAQRSAMDGLQNKPYDASAAAQDAFRTGAAIGSGGASVSHSADFPSWPQGAPPTTSDKVPRSQGGAVTLDEQTIAAYTDGHAYDILVVVPYGNSAGEFCFQYGVDKANALAVLRQSYAVTGEVSAHGPGNPRRQISWRSYPVSVGQQIKVGAEFKPGQVVSKPADYNAYETNPLR